MAYRRRAWNERLKPWGRMVLAVILTFALFVLLALSSLTPMNREEAESLSKEAEEFVRGKSGAMDIFLNNMLITLLAFIPFIGIPIMGYVIFQTGRVIGAISIESGVPSLLLILFIIISVFGAIEFLAYGTAIAENILFSYSIVKKTYRMEFRWLLISLGVSALLLLFAAFIESLLIQYFTQFYPGITT